MYERGVIIKIKSKNYCIYKNKRTDCLKRLNFDKTGQAIYQNNSFLSNTDASNNDWVVTDEYDYFIARDNLIHYK